MKKRSIVLLVFILIFQGLFSGCRYLAYKTYYSNVEDYVAVWQQAGFRHGYDGISPFFPETVENLEVKDFHARYDEQLPLGEGFQILLEIQYEAEMFDAEVERIKSFAFECSEKFEEINFVAYATQLGERGELFSEYALIDDETQVIRYIYLQMVPKEEIEFDHQWLPLDYSLGENSFTRIKE